MTRKTHAFSKKGLENRTPTWAKNMFRIVMYLNIAIAAWLASTNLFDTETKYEITLILNVVVTPLTHIISKMFGVETKEE